MSREIVIFDLTLTFTEESSRKIASQLLSRQGNAVIQCIAAVQSCFQTIQTLIQISSIQSQQILKVTFNKELRLGQSDENYPLEISFSLNQQQLQIFQGKCIIQSKSLKIAQDCFFHIETREGYQFNGIFNFNCTTIQQRPFLIIKDINCQLANINLALPEERYLELHIGPLKYRTKSILNKHLFWDKPLKMVAKDRNQIMKMFIVTTKIMKRLQIQILRLDCFTLKAGFKRFFITNQYSQPFGCIQLNYETRGFWTKEQQQRNEQIQENYNKKILKLEVIKIKGKLKEDRKKMCVKIFSGMNFIVSQCSPEESNQFQFDINNYLYINTEENECHFIIFSQGAKLGCGVMKLNIVGHFERTVALTSLESKMEVGFLMVKIQSVKLPAQWLNIRKISVKLPSYVRFSKKIYASFQVGGAYSKTQVQSVLESIVAFRKLVPLKFAVQETIVCSLKNEENILIYQQSILLSELRQSPNKMIERQLLSLSSPDDKCTLRMMCTFGQDSHQFKETDVQNRQIYETSVIQPKIKDVENVLQQNPQPKQLKQIHVKVEFQEQTGLIKLNKQLDKVEVNLDHKQRRDSIIMPNISKRTEVFRITNISKSLSFKTASLRSQKYQSKTYRQIKTKEQMKKKQLPKSKFAVFNNENPKLDIVAIFSKIQLRSHRLQPISKVRK